MADSCPSPLAHLAAFLIVFGAGVFVGRSGRDPTRPPHPSSGFSAEPGVSP